MKNNKVCLKHDAGFSLVEILVVLVIMSILAGVVVVNVVNKPGEARVATCRTNIQALQAALRLYKIDQGRYPTQAQGLEALIAQPTQEPVPSRYPQGGYLEATVMPVDPWGNPFVYLIPGRAGESYEVISYGADGAPGGVEYDADLSSSDP